MSIVEHLYAPISVRPSPDAAFAASDTRENTIAPGRRAVRSWFFWAMQLLPAQRRKAMHALYAFCRELDDIADGEASGSLKQILFSNWRRRLQISMLDGPSTM